MICEARCEKNRKRHDELGDYCIGDFLTQNQFHKSVLGKLSPADGQQKYRDSGGFVLNIKIKKLNKAK